jgi:beta-lactamase regulating signal transducer with metallopeptidase domain
MMHTLVEMSWSGWLSLAVATLLRGLLVLAIGGVLFTLMKRHLSAAGRHLLLVTVAMSLILLPLFSLVLPKLEVPVLKAEASVPSPAAGISAQLNRHVSLPRSSTPSVQTAQHTDKTSAVATAALSAPSVSTWQALPSGFWILPIWAAGVLICGLRALLDCALLVRLARECPEVPDGALRTLMAEMTEQSGLRRKIVLRQAPIGSRAVMVPITWGWRRPTLLLPAEEVLSEWPEERLRAVMLHELAHIHRIDWITQLVARMSCVLYWFNPLVWLLARQVQRESEQACDDQVIVAGVAAADYATHLMEIVRLLKTVRDSALSHNGAQAMARFGSPVEARVRAVLDVSRNRRKTSGRAAFSALLLTFAVLAPLAAIRPAARAVGQASHSKSRVTKDLPGGPRNLDFRQGIEGWSSTANGDNTTPNGNYAVGIDPVVQRNGIQCAYLQSADIRPQGYGVLRQDVPGKPFRGKRIRFSGYLKTEGIREYTGLLVSVIGQKHYETWAMGKRPILGTTDWRRYEHVVDVPQDCSLIMLGVSIKGSGKVWASEFQFETVGLDVPLTPEKPEVSKTDSGGSDEAPLEPVNMAFAQGLEGWGRMEEGDSSTPLAYSIGLDDSVRRAGIAMPFLTTNGSKPNGYANMVQYIQARNYRGKRIRLTGLVRTAGIKRFAGLWLAVQDPDKSVVWDAEKQPIRGNNDWTKQAIVVDVPKNANAIGLGIMMKGVGKVWAGDLKLESVDKSVPVTPLTLKLPWYGN